MRHTESKAFEKSINVHENVLFLALCNSRNVMRLKIRSMVELPLRNPAWFFY